MTSTNFRLIALQKLFDIPGASVAVQTGEIVEMVRDLLEARELIAQLQQTENSLREERVKLQDENEQLRSERRMQQAIDADIMRKPGEFFVPPTNADEREHVQELRLKALEDRTGQLTDHVNQLSMDGVNRELAENFRRIDARIDKVVEIIGERTARLVEAIDETRLRAGLGGMDEVAFPTGGASTAEAAAEAVPALPQRGDRHAFVVPEGMEAVIGADGRPTGEVTSAEVVPGLPKRGDRVRIEGLSYLGNGWYDVVGSEPRAFQIHYGMMRDGRKLLMWIGNDQEVLKEVRPGAAKDVEK